MVRNRQYDAYIIPLRTDCHHFFGYTRALALQYPEWWDAQRSGHVELGGEGRDILSTSLWFAPDGVIIIGGYLFGGSQTYVPFVSDYRVMGDELLKAAAAIGKGAKVFFPWQAWMYNAPIHAGGNQSSVMVEWLTVRLSEWTFVDTKEGTEDANNVSC